MLPRRGSEAALVEGDSLKWLNTFVEVLWPKVNATIKQIIRDKVAPRIEEKTKPLGVTLTVELGDKVPKVGPIKVYETRWGNLRVQLDIDYASDVEIKVEVGPCSV